MKKVLMTLMIASLLILPLGNVALADHVETPQTEAPQAEVIQTAAPLAEIPTAAFIPGNVPAESSVLDSMTPALHAAVLAMLNQDAASFSAEDSTLAWEGLYNMVSLYGQMDNRSEYLEDFLVLPTETVMDYSAALFCDLSVSGDLPESLSDRILYNAETDCYLVVCGDNGLSEIVLDRVETEADTLCVTGSLVYLVDGSPLAQFRAELTAQDNMFGYTISALELV